MTTLYISGGALYTHHVNTDAWLGSCGKFSGAVPQISLIMYTHTWLAIPQTVRHEKSRTTWITMPAV